MLIANDDELFALTAQTYWKTYKAFIAAGFSEEQALEIIKHQGVGFGKQ